MYFCQFFFYFNIQSCLSDSVFISFVPTVCCFVANFATLVMKLQEKLFISILYKNGRHKALKFYVSDVVNPALADASSSAWEFSLTFNSSALFANPR